MSGKQLLTIALGAFLAVGSLGSARAADEPKPGQGKGKFEGRGGRGGAIPPEAMEKMKLSDEQKEKIEMLQKEFMEKNKDNFTKMREMFQKQDKEGAQKLREEMSKSRNEMMEKVMGLLNDDQKKILGEMKGGPGKRPGRPGGKPGEGKPGEGKPGDAPGKGNRFGGRGGLPGMDKLNLTTEQKEKMAALEKELKEKMMSILTDDQKKQLEEGKKAGPGGDNPFRGGPGGDKKPGGFRGKVKPKENK